MEPLTLKLSIETTPDMDHTQVADARLVLRRELEDAPFAEFVEVPAAEAGPRPGSKGGEALTLGALLLAVLPEAVPAAIGFIKEGMGTAPRQPAGAGQAASGGQGAGG